VKKVIMSFSQDCKHIITAIMVASVMLTACNDRKPGEIVQGPEDPAVDSLQADTTAGASVEKLPPVDNPDDYLDSLVTSPEGSTRALNDTLKADFKGTVGTMDRKPTGAETHILKSVRTGTHAGFDRVVFEFGSVTIPGYHVEYIDKPVRACGSGHVVKMAGDAWLQVKFSPAQAHTDDGKATIVSRAFTLKYPNVIDLKSTCDYEGEVAWVVGVKSPKQYRVLELSNPTRIVVDVKQ